MVLLQGRILIIDGKNSHERISKSEWRHWVTILIVKQGRREDARACCDVINTSSSNDDVRIRTTNLLLLKKKTDLNIVVWLWRHRDVNQRVHFWKLSSQM